MDITEIQDQILYAEDLKKMTVSSAVGTEEVTISLNCTYTVGETSTTTALLSENVYFLTASSDTFNYYDAVADCCQPEIPADGEILGPDDSGGWASLTFTLDDLSYTCSANLFSEDAKTQLSYADFLSVPADGILMLNVWAGFESYSIDIIQEGVATEIYSDSGLDGAGRGWYAHALQVSDLNPGTKPFQLRVTGTDADDNKTVMYSPVYRVEAGRFHEFIFSSPLGGYESFPMWGDLRADLEYESESARYSSGYDRAYAISEILMTQYSGPLTARAAAALTRLLSAEYIYHRVDGQWKRIVVEDPEASINVKDQLHYLSFSFRYSDDDVTLSEIMEAADDVL